MSEFSLVFDCPDFLIINKPAGVLSQSSNDSGDKDLVHMVEQQFSHKLHLLTRLDRPVSGLCVFSKNSEFTKHFLEQQSNKKLTKKYLALVEAHLDLNNAIQTHYGKHNKKIKKMIIQDQKDASVKELTSRFNTLLKLDRYSLLEIEMNSGRFHQLRSQCAHLGHPIKGDVKYGARRSNKNRSIHLHSYEIRFLSRSLEEEVFQADLPKNDDLWGLVNEKLNRLNG